MRARRRIAAAASLAVITALLAPLARAAPPDDLDLKALFQSGIPKSLGLNVGVTWISIRYGGRAGSAKVRRSCPRTVQCRTASTRPSYGS